jgi:hypothetical protein
MKYLLIKKDPNGRVYETHEDKDENLVNHLKGCFKFTGHQIIAIINLEVK